MAYQFNDPNNEENRFFSGNRFGLFLLLCLTGLIVYLMADNIKGLWQEEKMQPQVVMTESPAAPTPATAQREINVGFLIPGRITHMYFNEGDSVKKSDVLATLDKTQLEYDLALAKAKRDEARASYDKASRVSSGDFKAIEAARANVETAEHAYDSAAKQLEKRRSMQRAGETDHVYENNVQEERDARLDLERARRELAHVQSQAGNMYDRDEARAALNTADLNVLAAERNLANAQLTAPADGTIGKRVSEAGATVAAGDTVYTIFIP